MAMDGKSTYKVPDGKLLKIALQAEEARIASVKIRGDFFLHPEESIELLEAGLKGEQLQQEKLMKKIASIVESNSIKLFGFNPADLAKAIMLAAEGGK